MPNSPIQSIYFLFLKIAIAYLCVFCCFSACGQSLPVDASEKADKGQLTHQYVSEEWKIDNNLPAGHINQLYQTPDGYVWMATFNGLIRFDGVKFKLYEVSNTPELPSNRFITIQAGQGNSFWLTTEQQHLIHVENEKYTVFGPFPELGRYEVFLDGDSLTWIISRRGLKQFKNGRLQNIDLRIPSKAKVAALLRLYNGALLVGDEEGNVYSLPYPYHNINWKTTFGDKELTKILFEDHNHNVWVANNHIGKKEGDSISLLSQEKISQKGWTGIPPLYFKILEDNNSNIWVRAETGLYQIKNGILKVVRKARHSEIPTEALRDGAGMCTCQDGSVWTVVDNYVYRNGELQFTTDEPASAILCDSEQNIWLTMGRYGLRRYHKSLLKVYTSADQHNNFYGVYEDRHHRIWFGEWYRNLNYLNRLSEVKKYIPNGPWSVSAAMAETSDGSFFIGNTRCSYKDRSPSGECRKFRTIKGLPEEVFAIYETEDSSVWFGTRYGLYRLFKEKLQFIPAADGREFPIRFFAESPDHNLWMATNGGGIRKFNYRTNRNTNFTQKTGLSSNNIRALFIDKKRMVWIATEDRGLNRLNPISGKINVIRSSDGLYDENLHSLLQDDFGRLWMSTNQGIFWVDLKQLTQFADGEIKHVHSTAYTERDGMLNKEANGGFQNAALKSADGNLWFATQEGIVRIDPAAIGIDHPLLPTLIESVTAEGKVISMDQGRIQLGKKQRNFSIHFTTPSFIAPNRIRFRYKLEGFDKHWVEDINRREAVYTNLPAGDYEFKVAAFYVNHSTNTPYTSLSVIKNPEVFETWWFRISLFLLIAFLIGLSFKWRTRQLKLNQATLERQISERTHELVEEKKITESQKERLLQLDKEKNRFFTNISHEFRTPLTLILGPLKALNGAKEGKNLSPDMKEQVKAGVKNANRLMRLVEQLLDIAKLEAGQFSLEVKTEALNEYVLEVAESFRGIAERKQIEYEILIPQKAIYISYDPRQFDKIITNLLSNAFKFTRAMGKVGIHLVAVDDKAIITVKDSGRGISAQHIPRLFDRFYQIEKTEMQPGSGIGLALVNELTQLHGGAIRVESTLGKGSAFIVEFPLGAPADIQVDQTLESLHSPALLKVGAAPSPDYLKEPAEEDKTSILIVDDSRDIRNYLAHRLSSKYYIMQASSGHAALKQMEHHLPDLIISDVMMPDGDGFELLSTIRQNPDYGFLPVILLTARAEAEDKLFGLDIGADDYITKPFDVEEIAARADNLLEQRKRLKLLYGKEAQEQRIVQLHPDDIEIQSQDNLFLFKLRTLVMEHLSDEQFSVEKMATWLNQSRSNLYRRVLSLTHETPSALIKRMRLERAADLLLSQAGSVSEVAYSCGFNSVAHFSKSFSKKYGVSPSSYNHSTAEK